MGIVLLLLRRACERAELRNHLSHHGGGDVTICVSTDIPGEIRRNASPGSLKTIFTGMRCTTFTKLPVAFSGGSKANCEPVPR